MGQNDLPPTIPPSDFLKEYWQYLLKDLWPVILPRLLTSGGHGLPGEIRGQLLKGILPGILPQITLPKGWETPRDRDSHIEEAMEIAEKHKDPEIGELLASVLRRAAKVPGGGSDPFKDEVTPEPREKPSPEPEKPRPSGKVIPLRKKARENSEELPLKVPRVGRKFKLRFIRGYMIDEMRRLGLKLPHIELQRIFMTFAERAGRESTNWYAQIGVNQLTDYLARRKKDLLVGAWGERRAEILRIGTSKPSVISYLDELKRQAYLLIPPRARGRPAYKGRPAYVTRWRVAMSPKDRFKIIMERKGQKAPRSKGT